MRAGASSLTKIEETLGFATGTAHFAPDAVIIDGFDFENATHEAVGRLSEIAQELSVEMWLSAKTDEYTEGPPSTMAAPTSTPTPLRRFFDDLAVIVLLQPHDDEIELRLLKDHDNPDLSELTLSLDPTTMRVVDEDLPVGGGVPTDPGSYTLIGGGARGAEAEFGACAERAGVNERHYSFDGHPFLERDRGVLVLSEDDLSKGDFSLVYVSHRLGRPMTQIPNIKRILQTVWHQITAANQVFVVGTITESGTVRGGTGWGAELARLWSKPLYVFDQVKGSWFHWDTTRWDAIDTPQITSRLFAGIGTTNITQEGRQAIRQLFDNSFNGGKSS